MLQGICETRKYLHFLKLSTFTQGIHVFPENPCKYSYSLKSRAR